MSPAALAATAPTLTASPRRSQPSPSTHCSGSYTCDLTSKCLHCLAMKGADRCHEDHPYAHSRWRPPEFLSQRHLPFPLSRRRPYPRHSRAVMRPTRDPTPSTDRIRATGITRSGVAAGTTVTPPLAGCPPSAGRRRRTGYRPLAGIPRPAGLHRRGGSALVRDHFSIYSTRSAAGSSRSEPAPTWRRLRADRRWS